MKQLNLPSIYLERERNPVPERYKKFIGRPALSYSSYNSFNEEAYKGEWFADKFLGAEKTSTIFTEFGSSVGSYLETGEPQKYLTELDMTVLNKEFPADPNSEYEREVVIDRGSYIIYGFIDRLIPKSKKENLIVNLKDFKTGAIDKKAKEYASEDYNQTTMYCYGLEQEGFTISDSGVILFDRKGNTLEEGNKNVLRLTGEIEYIPTPYSRDRAEKFIQKMDETAKEIEKYYSIYKKYFS